MVKTLLAFLIGAACGASLLLIKNHKLQQQYDSLGAEYAQHMLSKHIRIAP